MPGLLRIGALLPAALRGRHELPSGPWPPRAGAGTAALLHRWSPIRPAARALSAAYLAPLGALAWGARRLARPRRLAHVTARRVGRTGKTLDQAWSLPGSWAAALQDEVQSQSFEALQAFVEEQRSRGTVVYPPPEDVFKAFELCGLESIKVVILGQDPYHGAGQAHGLSFSVPAGVKLPPSLRSICQELSEDLGLPMPDNGDLTCWARQGVLLLNAVLTVESSKPLSHAKRGWEEFTDAVLSHISARRSGVVFLLWGNVARAKKRLLDIDKHHILEAMHPSPLSAWRGFFGCRHFSEANRLLLEQGLTAIDWSIPPLPEGSSSGGSGDTKAEPADPAVVPPGQWQDKPCVNIVGFGIHTQFNTRYSWDRDCAIDGAPTYWGVERDVFLYWRPPSGKWYLALSSRLENIKAGDDQFAFARTQQRGGPDPTPGWIQWEELRVYESREWAWVRADHVHISLSSSPIEVQRRIQEATVKAIEKGTPDSGYVDATNDPTGYSSALLGSAREHGLHLEGCGAEDFEDPDTFVAAAPPQVAPGEEQLPIGLLFPGQGSSHVGMMKEAKDIPAVKEMLHKAQEILGYDILPICLNGPEERLSQTWLCQPAMFIAGLAGLEKLRQEREEAVMRCQAVAGFSLGEYTALCAAGVFSFEVGLELVKLRGEAMQYAVRGGTQGMISVTGLGKARLVELCDRVEKNLGGTAVCKIAIDRFPKGFICGGTNEAIAKLKEYAVQAGSLAAQLPETFGAYHTSLMKHAEDKLRTALAAALPKMRPPRCSVYMNATASPMSAGTPPKRIVALLEKQMTSPVLWEQSVRAMSGDGVGEFYEVSPMKQIKEMLMHTDKAIWRATYNVEV